MLWIFNTMLIKIDYRGVFNQYDFFFDKKVLLHHILVKRWKKKRGGGEYKDLYKIKIDGIFFFLKESRERYFLLKQNRKFSTHHFQRQRFGALVLAGDFCKDSITIRLSRLSQIHESRNLLCASRTLVTIIRQQRLLTEELNPQL